jgi:hypothetical protein
MLPFRRRQHPEQEPPEQRVRPDVRSIDDGLAWMAARSWRTESDYERRQTVKRLLFTRQLVRTGRLQP